MPNVQFDRDYRYDDLIRFLYAYADEDPTLVRVQSIGKSYENPVTPTARPRAVWPQRFSLPQHLAHLDGLEDA